MATSVGEVGGATALAGPHRIRRRRGRNEAIWFWVFVGPFFDARNTVTPTHYVGLRNYVDMLTDPSFRHSLLTFSAFAAFIVPTTFVASLALALLVNRTRVARSGFRSVF